MIFIIASFSEILLINLLHTDILSKKKYSCLVTFLTLSIFTVTIILTFYLLGLISEESTVRSVLVGFLFVFPIYFLYNESLKKLVIIMVYCWTYTFVINTISFGLATSLNSDSISLYTLIIQTILIMFSVVFMFRFSRNRFQIVLDKSIDKTQFMLLILGASIFLAFVGIRYYIDPNTTIYLFLSFALLMISVMSYILIFTIVQSNLNLKTTKTIAYKDSLTGINNRYSLFMDFELIVNNRNNFSLLFLDLDDLKSVNDKHSHLVGDKYIKEFARILVKLSKNNGEVYRFAGDEFICLCDRTYSDQELKELEDKIIKEMNEFYEFNGVSIGIAHYPENGKVVDELINYADNAMYGEKNRKKVRK